MKRVASLLSELPPRQGAPARRDGALFQPLSAGIPPWAESGGKLCATQYHRAQALAKENSHLRATTLGPDPLAPPAVLKQEPDHLRAVMSF